MLLPQPPFNDRLCSQGRWGYRRVVKAFGSQILLADGTSGLYLAAHELCQREAQHAHAGGIDREKLGDLVFKDNKARKKLNEATHLPVALDLARKLAIQWFSFTSIVVRLVNLASAQLQRSETVWRLTCRWLTCLCCLRPLLTNSCGPGSL